MKSTVYKCDRCGRTMEAGFHIRLLRTYLSQEPVPRGRPHATGVMPMAEYDLCEKCIPYVHAVLDPLDGEKEASHEYPIVKGP